MASEGFVTYKEMTEYQDVIKKDLLERINRGDIQREKLENVVNAINDKVSHINDLVLPLTVAMEATANNTKEISQSLKEFTKTQNATNGMFQEKINDHKLEIEGLKTATNNLNDKKKYNVTVIVAIIGFAGIFVTGLFQLAPIIFK